MNFLEKIDNYLIEHEKISLKDKANFFGLFYTLQHAGISTLKALEILIKSTKNRKFKKVITEVQNDIQRGQNLSLSLAKFPYIFTETELGIIKTGETTGQLDKMLLKLKEKLNNDLQIQKDIKSASTYPIVVLLILALAGIIMFGFVIPQLKDLFSENNLQLPTITKVLMNMSEFLVANWSLLLAGLVLIYILMLSYFDTQNGQIKKDTWLLKTPILGQYLKLYYQFNFFDTLSNLIDAGVPLEESFDVIYNVVPNQIYKIQIAETQSLVKSGQPISDSILNSPFLFSQTYGEMLKVGEMSANISEMAKEVAKNAQNELSFKLKNLSTILGPLIIVFVGIMVAVFALAVLSPVFSLSEGVI